MLQNYEQYSVREKPDYDCYESQYDRAFRGTMCVTYRQLNNKISM